MQICRGVILTIQTFFKDKNNILLILNIGKTRISVTCVYKEYAINMQRLQIKVKYLLDYNTKIII